ncbi:50S ribosomal protein L21e [Candidatus Micrarchaeota archaeon]|nr:50S ribosomal protein L21e [Candidatus Micrarchaeota archaeon]
MAKRSAGYLSGKTRTLKRKRKLTVVDMVRGFKIGQTVVLNIQPYFKSLPSPRYNGRHGTIIKKQGNAYILEITDGNAKKKLVVSVVHLKEIPMGVAK